MHIHHHYPAEHNDTRLTRENAGDGVLIRYTPYFILALFALIILTGCCVILYFMAGVIVTLFTASAVFIAVVGGTVHSMMGQSSRESGDKSKR